jgi:microcystin-dependent protein
MSTPFVGEIRMFAFSFAPVGWALCAGQLLPISQNTALFSLLGTTYGGDGKSTFALPDLTARVPIQPGQGPGLSLRDLGEIGGTAETSLSIAELPAHTHPVNCNTANGNRQAPSGNYWAQNVGPSLEYSGSGAVPMADGAVVGGGGNVAHENRQPFLTLNFCIALQGVYPPRG